MTTDQLKFMANFPGNQTDIKIGKDGMRITLDVPLIEMPAALPLIKMTECVLAVTVEPHVKRDAQ